VSYRNWIITIASLDPEKVQGKLIIKAGDRIIFEDYLNKRQSLEIPYKPDKKDDTLTFITANQKSVSRPISFHEKIRQDRDFIKVHYMEHDCKCSINNNRQIFKESNINTQSREGESRPGGIPGIFYPI
jgi:hypothetical protein